MPFLFRIVFIFFLFWGESPATLWYPNASIKASSYFLMASPHRPSHIDTRSDTITIFIICNFAKEKPRKKERKKERMKEDGVLLHRDYPCSNIRLIVNMN